MKRIITIWVSLFAFLCAYAGNDCDKKVQDAKELFRQKEYGKARELFSFCCKECDLSECCQWIKRCDDSISADRQRQEEASNEIETKKRAERREHDSLVYLDVYSDVPGKFSNIESALKSDLSRSKFHCTSDIQKAYWLVRIVVSIFDETCDDVPQYRVCASVEVENAVKLNSKPKYWFDDEHGCCDSEINVANSIYKSKNSKLYEDIEQNVIGFLIGNDVHNISICDSSSVQKQEKVAIHVVSSNKNSFIASRIKSGLRTHFDNAENYIMLNRDDDDLKEYLEKEYKYQGTNVDEEERTNRGKDLGVDKICFVKIEDVNDALDFNCRFVGLAITEEKSIAVYRRPYKNDLIVTSSSDDIVDKVQIVSDVLAMQLGLLSEEQQKELENRIEQFRKKDEEAIKKDSIRFYDNMMKMIREDEILALSPGRYQRYYGQETNDYYMKTRGYLYPILEGISVIGIIGSSLQIGYNDCKGRKTTDPVDKEHYNRRNKTIWVPALGGSIGAAVLVYLFNIGDAHYSIHQAKNAYLRQAKNAGTICLNPVITDGSIVLTLNINF